MGAIYDKTYKSSIDNPEEFWAEAATRVHWYHQ